MFNKANLAVAALASKDNSRYALTHVFVSEEGMVASDGHIMGIVGPVKSETLDKPFTPFLVKAKDLDAIKRNMNGGSIHVSEENTLHVESKLGPITVKASDETSPFPNWKAILPAKEDATLTAGFNPELLIRALQLFGKIETVELRFKDANSCLRIDGMGPDGQTVTALVMPKPI